MFGATPEEKAYFAPFLALVGLILLGQVTAWFFDGRLVSWVLGEPAYWVNPAQALVGGALLLHYRRFYPLATPRRALGSRLSSEWWCSSFGSRLRSFSEFHPATRASIRFSSALPVLRIGSRFFCGL